jgi:hypothetical protein
VEASTAAAEAKAADGGVILGQSAIQAVEKALRTIGAICPGCDRPTYFHTVRGAAPTHEFKLAKAEVVKGRPKVIVETAFACDRRDCDAKEKWAAHPNVIAARTIPSWEIVVPPKPVDEDEGHFAKVDRCPSCGAEDQATAGPECEHELHAWHSTGEAWVEDGEAK